MPEGRVRRLIYQLWRKIHQMDLSQLRYSRSQVNLGLSDYLLVNNAKDPRSMSTQATGNTCYFQVCSPTQFYSVGFYTFKDQREKVCFRQTHSLVGFASLVFDGVLEPTSTQHTWRSLYLLRPGLHTTLESMMNVKLSPRGFYHCHENGLIKTIQTIPTTYVRVSS